MEAPREIPEELKDEFLMGGKMTLVEQYIDQASPEPQDKIREDYNEKNFDTLVKKARRRELGHYGPTDRFLYDALNALYQPNYKVLIIGSTIPWYEAILYDYGCRNIHVSEYGDRPNFSDAVKYIKPEELDDDYDLCISISSHEHCGLGRYGDPLDPNGDIKAIHALKKHIKPYGFLLLALPLGKDSLVWNAHRIYGKHRLPIVVEGWEVKAALGYDEKMLDIDRGIDGSYQPLLILRNKLENRS
jgi:hypothetical protein